MMTFDIPTPEELSSVDYETAVQLGVNEVVKSIKKAKIRGERKTMWLGYHKQTVNGISYEVEGALKKIFKTKGYWLEPYGYSGGVWQEDTYNICW